MTLLRNTYRCIEEGENAGEERQCTEVDVGAGARVLMESVPCVNRKRCHHFFRPILVGHRNNMFNLVVHVFATVLLELPSLDKTESRKSAAQRISVVQFVRILQQRPDILCQVVPVGMGPTADPGTTGCLLFSVRIYCDCR